MEAIGRIGAPLPLQVLGTPGGPVKTVPKGQGIYKWSQAQGTLLGSSVRLLSCPVWGGVC